MSSGRHPSKNPVWRLSLRIVVINAGTMIVLWLCLEAVFGLLAEGRVSVNSKIQFVTMSSRDFIVGDADKGYRLRANFPQFDSQHKFARLSWQRVAQGPRQSATGSGAR